MNIEEADCWKHELLNCIIELPQVIILKRFAGGSHDYQTG